MKNTPKKKTAKEIKKNTPVGAPDSFARFVFQERQNSRALVAGLMIALVYALALFYFFEKPSCYFDSGTYVQVARDNPAASFRPLGYSDFLRFFHNLSPSAPLVVMAQFASNVVANLFLYFSLIYFFRVGKWYRMALFLLLAANPLYILYSNYLLSEAFFCSLTVLWFASLLWIIRRPGWINFGLQLFLLMLIFKLRYNAVLFPLFSTAAILISPQAKWKKALGIAFSFLIIVATVRNISRKTEEATGTPVFSAFGGWQLATNALNVLEYTSLDTSALKTVESREIYQLARRYFDSLARVNPNTGHREIKINPSYLWDPNTPLRQYLPIYAQKKYIPTYFKVWTALGPVYNDFGKEVIMNKPFAYARYYMVPNSKDYWYPPLEAYESYNNNKPVNDTIFRGYYHFKNDSTDLRHAGLHNAVMHPWKYIFPALNVLFLALVVLFFVSGAHRRAGKFFITSLLLMAALYVYNYFFSVALAPTVFRYHVWIVTLCAAWVCLLSYYVLQRVKDVE